MNNRVTIASALAPAFILVAGAALACSVFPSPVVRARAFSVTIGLICGMNYLAVSGINCLWSEAAGRQTAILRLVASHVPALPHASTLLLDGFCRYRGPGVVFESDTDTTAAVQLTLNDFSLKGDVVSPNLHFNDKGIDEFIYGQPENHFSYGDHVFVFNTRSQTLTPLPSQQAALAYLRAFNPTGDNGCPPARQDGEKLF